MGRTISIAGGIAAVLVGVGVATACPATADNDSYLAALGDRVPSRNGATGLLAAGKESCRLLAPNSYLMFGRAPHVVSRMIWEAAPSLERDQADLIVNTAIDHLCPGVNPFAPGAPPPPPPP